MRNTILNKFIFTYITIIILAFFCVAVISYRIDYHKELTAVSDKMYRQAAFISNGYAGYYYSGVTSLERLTTELMTVATYNDTVIMLLDPYGEILLNTYEPVLPDAPVIIEAFDPIENGTRRYTIDNFYGYFPEEYLTVLAPVTFNLKIRGYVLIHKSIDSIKSELAPVFNTNYITLIMCMILTLFPIFIVYFNYHRPIKEITLAVKEFGHGNLKYRLREYNDDEIGRLAASLTYMSKQLYEMDESQKKFVANVSHDFRSPLTSIKGYLEAILDGTIPHEMQDKYLNIVISETERLSKLTNNLLTLNNIDSRKTRLNMEVFDINSVIKRTIETFEGICSSKGIKFELTFCAKSLPVYADLEKINQVLYNLIDNAIKFSHHNSTIFITVTERVEKAFISVKDTGIGIPKESVNKIWERFYKTDLSRGKDKKGTGLGLSIVKEIINTHEENIDVISTEGVGTEFTFSLTKYVEK